jgi:hypothetical protein
VVISTALSGAKCYAIKRNNGFKYLFENGVTTPSKSTIENIIKKNKLGEVNVNKNFLRENSQETTSKNKNSSKSRAVIFRRSLVQKQLRESLDKCKFLRYTNVKFRRKMWLRNLKNGLHIIGKSL